MKNGTEARYTGYTQPTCDVHNYRFNMPGIPAFYDGKIAGGTAWGYMCEACFHDYGSGLGTGYGQKLIFTKEQLITQ